MPLTAWCLYPEQSRSLPCLISSVLAHRYTLRLSEKAHPSATLLPEKGCKVVTVSEVDLKIEGHIDKCDIRYQGIQQEMRAVNARLKRIEEIGISVAGAIILLLVHIVTKG